MKKGEIACYKQFLPFSQFPQLHIFNASKCGIVWLWVNSLPFPKWQILDSSKLKEFAGENFKFDENSRKFSMMYRNTVKKRRNCSLWAISFFPTVFSKCLYCRPVKTRACLGKG